MNIFTKLAKQFTHYKDNLLKRQQIRMEISRLASLANKRVKRLENNELTDSPAYKAYIESGGTKFGVRGKDKNELKRELSRLQRFVESETSTVRGANRTMKTIAKATGISYKTMKDLKKKSKVFFELAGKIEQYNQQMQQVADDIGYQKIWEAINVYVKKEKVDLAAAEDRVDEMVKEIDKYLIESQKNIPGPIPGRFFKLKK